MNIYEALSLHKNEKSVISLVGGGGKTSLMFRLAEELKTLQRKVLVSTTTAIYYPEKAKYDNLFLWNDKDNLYQVVKNQNQGIISVLGNHVTWENKLKGILPEWVDDLYYLNVFDNIIVEADGAKKKPIKAPDTHEPVIPGCTTHLVGVLGFDSYLQEIGQDWVHRPELLAAVAEKKLGDHIDKEVIERLVLSSNGLFKNCPITAEKILFINKVDNDEQYEIVKELGSSILKRSKDIANVVIGRLKHKDPVINVMER